MDAILIATVFTLAFAGTLALLGARSGHPVAADELLQRVHGADDAGNVVVDRRGRVPESRFASALLRRVNLVRKLEQYMWQAGLYWRVSEIMLAELVLLLFGLTAGWVAWNDPLLAGACGAALFTLPLLYIGMRRKRRLKAFMAQLPYVLDMLKSTVEAGHSLQRALRMAVDEFSDPISGEFRTVLEQTRMGVPLARALEDMLIRVPEDDLRLMVTAIKMQTQVGSSLAHLVGRLSRGGSHQAALACASSRAYRPIAPERNAGRLAAGVRPRHFFGS